MPRAVQPPVATPERPRFSEALAYWLKLGFISFGGPAGQIAVMHHDLVERKRWISERRFLHALNYCMVLPGPEAQQLATYIGWLLHRTWGGLLAGGLFVLPSLLILIALSWLYMSHGHLPAVASVLYGIKPAITVIVIAAAVRLGRRTLINGGLRALALASFVAIFLFRLPFPLIVLAAALLGWIGGRRWPHAFTVLGTRSGDGSGEPAAKALIDEQSPLPEHARFRWPRFARVLAVVLLLWAAAMAALAVLHGWHGTLTQMGWFFTKAALLTFGGAYAVLPYVYQGAVEHHHWLTGAQMIDGLALGETTPGPLIMVVAFVGFVGGWGQGLFGPDLPWLSGAVAACVVTFFTFLPSFGFIFLGAPFIETTRGQLRFTAPLTAITAAVVGVIVNLAVFFAGHVLWPAGPAGPFEWPALVIGAVAAVALWRFKLGVMPLVALCGGLGWAAGAFGLLR